MTSVHLAGESGQITEIIEIGPASLVRHRTWANLRPLADACRAAGFEPRILGPEPVPGELPSPSVWLLSDLPLLSAEAFGILACLQRDVPARSGLVMIGGAFSFGGLKAVGGWYDERAAALLPVEPIAGADDVEAPAGVRLVPSPACPPELASVLSAAPPFYGYNRLVARPDATVLASFDDGAPALVVSAARPHRSVAFASDLLPHWAQTIATWDGFSSLIGGFCRLACGDAR